FHLRTMEKVHARTASDGVDGLPAPRSTVSGLCMSLPGVPTEGARTMTKSAVGGAVHHDPRPCEEFFALTGIEREETDHGNQADVRHRGGQPGRRHRRPDAA